MTRRHHDVTIVGGGFAGLAAALRLHRGGAKIRILEKRPFFGGRAYSILEPKTGQVVDNGQHLLMGAYHETFHFLKKLGTFSYLDFQKGLEVSFARDAESFFRLKCPPLPAPFHLAWGLLRYKGLKFRDKRRMAALINFCKKHSGNGMHLDQWSVTRLLKETGQTSESIKNFWEPVGLATLNEKMDQASAKLFLEVLNRGLLAKKEDSNLVIPRVGFSELYADPAKSYFEAQGVPLSFQTQVSQIERQQNRWLLSTQAGEKFESDYLLMAVPPNALAKILQNSPAKFTEHFPHLDQFKPSPIVSINLWFKDFHPQEKFVGLIDSPIHWIFNKTKVFHGERGEYLSLVVSGAYELAEKNKSELVRLAVREIGKVYPRLRAQEPEHSQVIKENEATFTGRVGLECHRPSFKTAIPGLFLAGDWTATGLPATIESAVQSGHQAADAILHH